MKQLQKLFTYILKPFSTNMTALSTDKRQNIVFICNCLFASYFIVYFIKATYKYMYEDLTRNHLIGCLVLFVIIAVSIEGPLKEIEWNKTLFYLIVTSSLLMLMISFIHPVGSGYRALALMQLLGYPCFYYVFNNNRRYKELFTSISIAFAITGDIYYIYCYLLAYRGEFNSYAGRVSANMYNANLFSMTGMVMCIAAAYLMLEKKESNKWFAFNSVTAGIGCSMVFFGGSRLSVLILAGIVVCMVIFVFKNDRQLGQVHNTQKKRLVRIVKIAIVFGCCAVFLLMGPVMIGINSATIEKITPVTELTPESMETDTPFSMGRFTTEGKDLNTFSSGREELWRNYARYLNLLGNDFSKTDWTDLTNNTVSHAHNNFFEYAYRFGVPVAILQLIIELYAGIYALKYLFNRKYTEPMYFFVVICMMTYAGESMLDIATLPFERHAPFLFYMALAPIMTEPYLITGFSKKSTKQESDYEQLQV